MTKPTLADQLGNAQLRAIEQEGAPMTQRDALEQIQLLACNHSGWVENDAWGGICEIHRVATAGIALEPVSPNKCRTCGKPLTNCPSCQRDWES